MTMFLKTLANRFYLFHKDWIVDCVLLLPLNSTRDIFQITSKIDLLFQKWKPRTKSLTLQKSNCHYFMCQ